MIRISTIALAAVLTLAGASSLQAGNQTVETVYYGDLNLADSKGIERLQSRIKRAVNSVCFVRSGTVSLHYRMAQRRCIANAMREAEPQIARALIRGKNGPSLAAAPQEFEIAVR